jgi:4-hydroxy-tetrahydrodipicolinate synthase
LPAYYPLTPKQIENYFIQLADKIPGSLIIYNIPATTKISIPVETVNRLSRHRKIAGLKDSERSTERMQQLTELFSMREDWMTFSGWTNRSTYALKMGFDGIVPSTGNLIPHQFMRLYRAVRSGNTDLADKLQADIDPIADFHQKDLVLSDNIALLKLMMGTFGLCSPAVLPPLSRFKSDLEAEIKSRVRELNIDTVREG